MFETSKREDEGCGQVCFFTIFAEFLEIGLGGWKLIVGRCVCLLLAPSEKAREKISVLTQQEEC